MLVPFLRIVQEYTFNANGCGGAESISGSFEKGVKVLLSCRFLLTLRMKSIKRKRMDTIQLNISKQQFFGMLQAMPEQDKLEVFDRLRKSLFISRFDRLLKSVRTDELSMDDITREVEAVRQEHYEERKQ